MSLETQIEREENYLAQQLADGEITLAEFNAKMRELQRDYRAEAEEAAEAAYNDVMGDW